jgi:nucleoside-diphosphate-sugar epimerase
MKRTVITGGTGFVGACLARRLLIDGHEVHLLVRPQHDPWRIADIHADLRLHPARLDDDLALRRTLHDVRAEWIFHLAVHGAYSHQADIRTIVDTNVIGTSVLLNAAVAEGFEAFVNAGSSSEYGFRSGPAREDDPLEPNSAYAVSKAAATMMCRHVARSTGAHITTLRLYSVFGPFEEPTRLMPRLLVAASRGRLPPLAQPETARDFVYVDDVVDAFLAAVAAPIDEPGAVLNVCTGVQTTLRNLVDVCRAEFGIDAPAEWGTLPARPWDTSSWVGDPSRAARDLGWTSAIDVRQGARRFVEWLQHRQDLLPRYLSAAGLGPA